jgi:hypothetical protein
VSARENFDRVYGEICNDEGWIFGASQVDVKFADGRHQIVHLDFFEHNDDALVRFHSVIGNTRKIRQDRLHFALEVNFGLPLGCFAVHGDMFVMVDTMLLANADPAEVRAMIRYLAETSDYYERTMFGPDAY